MKEFLDRFAAIVAIVTFSIVVLSLCHEYGYFFSVGRQFQAFISTSDYFANATLWLPATLVLMWGLIDWRQLKVPLLPTKDSWKSWIAPVGMLVMLPLFWIFFGRVLFPFPILASLFYLWAVIMFPKLMPPKADNDLVAILGRAIAFGIPIAVAVFTLGLVDGYSDLENHDNPYSIQFKDNEQPKELLLLRIFDKGILVRDQTKSRVDFFKWENVVSIGRIAVPTKNEPLSCSWFGIWCKDIQKP